MRRAFYDLSLAARQFIKIRGTTYPVTIAGTGPIQCLAIGTGSLMQRTYSDDFRKKFTVFSTDLYWVQSGKMANPIALGMDELAQDVNDTIAQLGLRNYFLGGNSCFGMLAMHAVKLKRDPELRGILAMGAAPCWNPTMNERTLRFFMDKAMPDRVAQYRADKKEYEQTKKPGESEVSVNAYYTDRARYWGHIPNRATIEALWEGVDAEDGMMNHFFGKLLPEYDLSKTAPHVHVPMLVAGGRHDTDSLPLVLWDEYPSHKPKNLTVVDCGEVGHWPNYEAPDVHDKATFEWADKVVAEVLAQLNSRVRNL